MQGTALGVWLVTRTDPMPESIGRMQSEADL